MIFMSFFVSCKWEKQPNLGSALCRTEGCKEGGKYWGKNGIFQRWEGKPPRLDHDHPSNLSKQKKRYGKDIHAINHFNKLVKKRIEQGVCPREAVKILLFSF